MPADDETVDLVDAHGTTRTRGTPRSEAQAHRRELTAAGLYLPIVIAVVVDHRGRILAHTRSAGKDEAAGEIDLVCGAITSGETWQQAAHREAAEELGVRIHGLTLVSQGVNEYARYRTLAVARTRDRPRHPEGSEVAGIIAAPLYELRRREQRAHRFVRGFFGDVEQALTTLIAAAA